MPGTVIIWVIIVIFFPSLSYLPGCCDCTNAAIYDFGHVLYVNDNYDNSLGNFDSIPKLTYNNIGICTIAKFIDFHLPPYFPMPSITILP